MRDQKLYRSKCVTPAEAVSMIKSGDRVLLAHAAAEPPVLVRAMTENHEAYENVEITHMVSLGSGDYCKPEYAKNFRFNGAFISGNTRAAVSEARADYTPLYLHQWPTLIRNGDFPIDVIMVMASMPDEEGYCYFGVSSDFTLQGTKSARIVLGELNDQVPRTYGENRIHIGEFTCFIETSHPIAEQKTPQITELDEVIAEHCASLIEDGSTLQLGIGGIPNAVMEFMTKKKDLGIHSEMVSDWIVDLTEAGVINGKKKSIHSGVSIATFAMGTKKLYDWLDRNPSVCLRTSDYVNNPAVIAENSRMVSINSCIEVDLMGQVVSDCIGLKQFSGAGGQVDFVRGAAMSKDGLGKSVMAFHSTAGKKDGTLVSKVVPFISPGAAVTTSRYDVDYVVTEYGIARLKCRTLRDRARSLISVAHPDFRAELAEEYERRYNEKF